MRIAYLVLAIIGLASMEPARAVAQDAESPQPRAKVIRPEMAPGSILPAAPSPARASPQPDVSALALPPTITDVSPTNGPMEGQTSVTISGTNFIAGTTATIGGVAFSNLVVVSSTQLSAVTPASTSGERDVVVTTGGGTATCSRCFRYGPQLPPGESIAEAWERSGEGPRGLWTVELLQRGVGTSVGLTAHCPAGTRAIGAGIENSAMTPFALWQSHPKLNPPGWYILMHRNLVPPVGGGNPYPPTPYTFFMTVTCVDVTAWNRAMSAPPP